MKGGWYRLQTQFRREPSSTALGYLGKAGPLRDDLLPSAALSHQTSERAFLLDDLEREGAQLGWKLHVRVYDDASSSDYPLIWARLAARGWDYVRAEQSHGKREIAKIVP